jgi:predicted HicB family RNase H-like nuclease
MKKHAHILPIRIPPEVKQWLKEQAEMNGSSQNSEVIRALRAAIAANPTKTNHS